MVPEGWAASTVGSVTSVVTKGATPTTYGHDFINQSSNAVRFIGAYNCSFDGTFKDDSEKWISKDADTMLKRSKLSAGDSVFCIVGNTVGSSFCVGEKIIPANINQNVALIRPNLNIIRPDYLHFWLRSSYIQWQVRQEASTQAQPSLSLKQVGDFRISIPPLPEQTKIAQILSTWDNAIETTEKLIKNSKAQKKALMQQLLTGMVKITRFETSQWKQARIDEICKLLKGAGLSKDKLSEDGKQKCILYGELYTRYGEVIVDVVNRTNVIEGRRSVSGDVLIPASTTTTGIDLANATSIKEDDVLLSGDINILRPNKKVVNPDFLAYALTHAKKHDLARLAQGITIIHLYGKDIKSVVVDLPPTVEEQDEIVSVFASADKQIRTLEDSLFKLKQEKKALMQQLLTGKRRVKLDRSEINKVAV